MNDSRDRPDGQLVLWIGAAGGVGVTRAVVDAIEVGDIAIDLDLRHAALGRTLGLPTETPSIAGVLDVRAGDIDELLVLAMESDVPGRAGARVILAPRAPEVADLLDAERVAEVLAVARGLHGRVLVDGGSHVDAIVDAACARATTIVLVVRNDPSELERVSELIAMLRRGAVQARIELDLRDSRSRRPIASGRAAFALGVAPSQHHSVSAVRRATRGRSLLQVRRLIGRWA